MDTRKTSLFIAAVLLVVAESIVLPAQKRNEELCEPKFKEYNVNHTACLPPPVGSDIPVTEGVSAESRAYIVSLHNYYRTNVHLYNKQPPATNMQKMYWDDELAMLAQKWASHCIWEHDASNRRVVPGSYPVGQNLGRGHRGWGTVISHWQSEVDYLTFGEGKQPDRPIGHYTQMVWADSSRIGCGYARCNRTQAFYVCDYAPTGNMVKSKYTPYAAGNTTTSCPNTATPGLCDCKGKICQNGGKLDLNTCQCKCINKPWIQQHGNCALDCSKAEDSFACASNGGRWGIPECGMYVNVPHEYCPITCNLCPANSGAVSAGSSTTWPKPSVGINVASTGATQSPTSITEALPVEPTSPFSVDQSNDTWWDSVLNGNAQRQNTPPVPAPVFQTSTPAFKVPSTNPPPSPLVTEPPTTRRPSPPVSTTTTTTPTTPSPTTPSPTTTGVGLPVCRNPVEIAKCGQPSSRGYYNPMYCAYGLAHYCPAMCGTCRVTSCVDYEARTYQIGQEWMNEYGVLKCTSSGVAVRRGCHIEKVGVVISEQEEHTYLDGNIRWRCVCNVGYSLSCKGVLTPSSKPQK